MKPIPQSKYFAVFFYKLGQNPFHYCLINESAFIKTGGDSLTEEMLRKYIDLYHGAVFRLAYSYLRNRADAEDVCEETFIKLYSYNGMFEKDENCKAWLMKVTVNLSKNMLKSCWFSKRTELDENTPVTTQEDYELSQKIQKLSSAYRLVIHLW